MLNIVFKHIFTWEVENYDTDTQKLKAQKLKA
jgi:hypothetical protein